MAAKKILGLGVVVVFLGGCQSWQFRDIEKLPPTAASPGPSEPGIVRVNYYDGISGSKVADLLNSSLFPDSPTDIIEINQLERLDNRGDNYGAFIRGFIIPPSDGEYQFFVSGDDETEFWLSGDRTPENAVRIATAPSYTSRNDYTKYSSQTSPLMQLTGNQRYYFELRFKEGGGNDHFSVAWQGPGISQQIVSSNYLASWGTTEQERELSTHEAYSLGYRVGHFDGSQGLAFSPSYPPLDEDNDGIYDNWEVHYGLDPTNPEDALSDLDNDFLTAYDEFELGTNPTNPDSDGDGIPDGLEFLWGLDPLDPSDASEDLDGDGFTNLEEYLAGTDPTDPEDMPELEPVFIQGFAAQYYEGMEFDRFVLIQIDSTIDFNWGRERPLPDLPPDQFSIRWSGIFQPPHTSGSREYRFTATTDDGVRLYANGQMVVDDWSDHGAKSFSFTRQLAADEALPIVMEYYDNMYGALARFVITDLSTGSTIPSQSAVYTIDPSTEHSLDSDGDGIPDTWELKHGLNPFTDDANNVVNTSGVTNIDAYNSELDPWTLTETTSPPATSDEPQTTPPTDSGSVTVSWTAPGTRMDGSSLALSEIEQYEIRYGNDRENLNLVQTVEGQETSYTFTGLTSGLWHFSISVIDTNGLRSSPSEILTYEIQ